MDSKEQIAYGGKDNLLVMWTFLFLFFLFLLRTIHGYYYQWNICIYSGEIRGRTTNIPPTTWVATAGFSGDWRLLLPAPNRRLLSVTVQLQYALHGTLNQGDNVMETWTMRSKNTSIPVINYETHAL